MDSPRKKLFCKKNIRREKMKLKIKEREGEGGREGEGEINRDG